MDCTSFIESCSFSECSKHKLAKDIIYIFDDSNKPLNCIQCFREKKIQNVSDQLHCKELLAEVDSFIFDNFPPLEESVRKRLGDILIQKNENIEILKNIEDYFKELSNDTQRYIFLVKEKVKGKVIQFIQSNEDIMNKYNSISFKKELQQILKQGGKEMETRISQILKEVTKQEVIKNNSKILAEQLNQFQMWKEKLDLSKPQKIKQDIINLISEIDFFYGVPKIQSEKLSKNNNDTPKSEDYLNSNCKILIDLIGSKTNFCEEEFLNRVKEMMEGASKFINSYYLGDNICNKRARDAFQQLNQRQINKMADLSIKILEISNSYVKQNVPQDEITSSIQPNSAKLVKLVGNIPQKHLLQSLLKQYPLIELVPNLFSTSILNQVNLQKSQHQNSHLLEISINDEGHLVAASSRQSSWKMSYCDFILHQNKKYVFRVSISQQKHSKKEDLMFGLLEDSFKDEDHIFNLKMAFCQYDPCGMSKIIRGQLLCSDNDKPVQRQLEMRIHLKDKILRVADYPQYQNVCELNNPNKIKIDTEYRFGMEFYESSIMKITQILEVIDFDEKM